LLRNGMEPPPDSRDLQGASREVILRRHLPKQKRQASPDEASHDTDRQQKAGGTAPAGL